MNVKDIVTKSRIKKVVALAVVCAVAYGGGSYYMHSQREAAHARAMEANSTIVANEAAQRNVTIVDKATVQSNVAEAIGQDEGSITWKSVNLTDGMPPQGKHHDKDKKDDHKEHGERHDGDKQHNDFDKEPHDFQGAPMNNADMPAPPQQGQAPATPPQMNGAQPPQMNGQALPQPPTAPADATQAQANTQNDANANGDQTKAQPQKGPQAPFHPVYMVKCEANGVHYIAAVDAISGNVIHCEAR